MFDIQDIDLKILLPIFIGSVGKSVLRSDSSMNRHREMMERLSRIIEKGRKIRDLLDKKIAES